MSGAMTTVFVTIILSWVMFALTSLRTDLYLATALGLIFGVVAVVMLKDNVALRGFVAVLEPIGLVLPLLALWHVAIRYGAPIAMPGSIELLLFLGLYVLFLLTAFGIIPLELYRHGYAPWPVAGMVLLACLYGVLTGNLLVPVVAVLGQVMWALGWGSSNWFDHVLHVLLVPIVVVTLVLRVI